MSAWALYSPAVGGGIEEKSSIEIQNSIHAIFCFLCDVFGIGNAALNDTP